MAFSSMDVANGTKVYVAKCAAISIMLLQDDADHDTPHDVYIVDSVSRIYPPGDETRWGSRAKCAQSVHLLVFRCGGSMRVVPALRVESIGVRHGKYLIPGRDSVWAAPFAAYAQACLLPQAMSGAAITFPPGRWMSAAASVTTDPRIWAHAVVVPQIPAALRDFATPDHVRRRVLLVSLKKWFVFPHIAVTVAPAGADAHGAEDAAPPYNFGTFPAECAPGQWTAGT